MAIAGAVVGGERDFDQRAHSDLAINHPGPLPHPAEAEDGDLRWVDHAGHGIGPALAQAGDRGGGVHQLGTAQSAGPGAGDEIAQPGHQVGQGKAVHIVDRGCNQPAAAQRDRPADVHAGCRLETC